MLGWYSKTMDAVPIVHSGWRIVMTDDVRVVDCHWADVTPRLRKGRAIIAVLAGAVECRMKRSDVIGLMWSDRGAEQARASLRQCLFALRTEVPALVEADSEWVWLAFTAVTPSADEQAEASLARLYGVDPALDRWLVDRQPTADIVRQVAAAGHHPARRQAYRGWLAGLGCVALIAASFGWWFQRPPPDVLPALTVVGIAPFAAVPAAGQSGAIADGMVDDIRALLPADRLQVRISDGTGGKSGQISRLGAEWIISGIVDAREGAGKVHVQIATTDGRLIWARDVYAAPGRLSDAGANAAMRIAMATGCALNGPRTHRDPDVLGLLFVACDRLDFSGENYNHEQALLALRQLALRAPDDALALSYYGTGLAVTSYYMPPAIAKAQRRESGRILDRAQRLNPRIGEAWVGRYALVEDDRAWVLREAQLVHGLTVQPDNIVLNNFMAAFFDSAGREEEALLFAQRAMAIGPALLSTTLATARILRSLGRPREAIVALDIADHHSPRNPKQARQRLDILLDSGDTKGAREILDHAAEIPNFLEPSRELAIRRLTLAMDAPNGRLADDVAQAAIAEADAMPDHASDGFIVLTRLGRDAAAFNVALRHPIGTEAFFRPLSRNVLRNPRFPELARRAGLWNYWQRSGHWPDACADLKLQWRCGSSVISASIPG